jgi:hypothetical protein
MDFDDPKTTLISCQWINCAAVDVGSTSNGAEVLNCFIIDPDSANDSDNPGLKIGTTTHNVSFVSFITSGTPTTQHMVELTQAADYSLEMDGFIFFGSYASSTIWHGENSGSNADVTINAVQGSGTNVSASEFENTASGTVSVVNAVNIDVHVEDSGGVDIQDAQCFIEKATPSVYTSTVTGNNQGDVDFVVQESIASDTPTAGWVQIKRDYATTSETEQWYRYSSFSGSTFSFPTKIGPTACTGGGTGTDLQDNVTTNFLTADIEVGDTVRNETDGSWAIVTEITDADNIVTTPLQGGSDNTWTSGDNYSFHTLAVAYDGSDIAWTPWMNELTDSSGDATASGNYVIDASITIKVRKFAYKTFRGTGTVTDQGFSVNVILADEPNVGL